MTGRSGPHHCSFIWFTSMHMTIKLYFTYLPGQPWDSSPAEERCYSIFCMPSAKFPSRSFKAKLCMRTFSYFKSLKSECLSVLAPFERVSMFKALEICFEERITVQIGLISEKFISTPYLHLLFLRDLGFDSRQEP